MQPLKNTVVRIPGPSSGVPFDVKDQGLGRSHQRYLFCMIRSECSGWLDRNMNLFEVKLVTRNDDFMVQNEI